MKQIATQGIVLARINYGEADRIITVLTADQGKIRLLAKGVRKIKSKMAGGIELFSVNDLTYIAGKGDMGTLISSRVKTNFGAIIQDINRTMFAYEVLKQINKITEDSPEPEYFHALFQVLAAINELSISEASIRLWFTMRLLVMGGHAPNVQTTEQGEKLRENGDYIFDFDAMAFVERPQGPFTSRHIKLLRLSQNVESPHKLTQVQTSAEITSAAMQLVTNIYKQQGYV